MNIVLQSYGKRSLTWFRSSYAKGVRYPTTSEYVERISSGLVNQVRGKERCSRARLVYDPVIQRDRNDEKKNPEKRERLNISKRSEESRRAGGRWWETRKVQHSSGPSSILRLEKRRIYYSYPELWQNAISLDRSDLLISLTGSICSILREIYDPRAVEKLRVSIRVWSFVAVIEAI